MTAAAVATASPPVIAPEGRPRCGKAQGSQGGLRCERPPLHAGGHLDATHGVYWPAGETPAEPERCDGCRYPLGSLGHDKHLRGML